MTTQSLHKGLRRELPHVIYDTGLRNRERLPSPPKTHSRAKNYRTMREAMLQFFNGLLIHVSEYTPRRKKDHATIILALNTLKASPETIVIAKYTISYRNPHKPASDELMIYPSNHALERIYQRRHTTDHGDVLQELNAPVMFFMVADFLEPEQFWEIGTGNGMAIVAINPAPEVGPEAIKAVILTWIDADKLRPGQSQEYMMIREITADNTPLMEATKLPIELQFTNAN